MNAGDAAATVVEVALGERSYPIHLGYGLLREPDLLRGCLRGRQVAVVSNDVVAPLYLQRLRGPSATVTSWTCS